MRPESAPKTKLRRRPDREANARLKLRRLLEMEVLEDRLPVSEQVGTALGVSALSYVGGLTAGLALPLVGQHDPAATVRTQEPSNTSQIAVVWPNSSPESASSRPAGATDPLPQRSDPPRAVLVAPLPSLANDDGGAQPFDDLTQDFFDLLGSTGRGSEVG